VIDCLLAGTVRNRLKRIQHRPDLISEFLAQTGLILEPGPPPRSVPKPRDAARTAGRGRRAAGQATTFLVQTLVLARPGTVLTSTADGTGPRATLAGHHASDTTRVQR